MESGDGNFKLLLSKDSLEVNCSQMITRGKYKQIHRIAYRIDQTKEGGV